MEEQQVQLTRADINRLLAALGEIERYTQAARSILAKTIPLTRKPGGAQCGREWADSHGGAQCGREYADRVGGPQCVREYDDATGTVTNVP